jgi:hypothetical protein
MHYLEYLEEEEFQEKMESKFMNLDIKSLHYLFWFAFTEHSIQVIRDRYERENTLSEEIQLELFENIKEEITSCLDVYTEELIKGGFPSKDMCHLELRFLDAVILHDYLDMFCATLLCNKQEIMVEIGREYLNVLRKRLAEKENLYRLTVLYLFREKRGRVE